MDTQTVVDKVLKHLWDQGECSQDLRKLGCLYRGHGGTKCAIGILIPDDIYSPDMEGLSFYKLCQHYDAVANLPEIQAIKQVGHILQRLHDELSGVPDFRQTLKRRAIHMLYPSHNLWINLPHKE